MVRPVRERLRSRLMRRLPGFSFLRLPRHLPRFPRHLPRFPRHLPLFPRHLFRFPRHLFRFPGLPRLSRRLSRMSRTTRFPRLSRALRSLSRRLPAAALPALLLPTPAPAQWYPEPDLILTGAEVRTVDAGDSLAEALAIKDGRLVAVGSAAAVESLAGPATRIVALEGRTVIPGLQDSHIHFLPLGLDITTGVELSYAESAAEIVAGVRSRLAESAVPPGEWIVGRRWDQHKYPVMVTRWQLDEAAPDHPVALYRVYRGVAVNTEVFRRMGIEDGDSATWPDWWLEDPADFTFEDQILREPRELTVDGELVTREIPTGVFLGSRASRLVTERPPPADFEEEVESVRLGVAEMLSLGVTAIVDPSSRMGHNMMIYQEAANRGHLRFRIAAVYEGTFNTHPPEEIAGHLAPLRVNNLGDRFLRWRGAKVYGDGGVGTRSAWMSEPFHMWDELEGEENLGNPVVRDYDLREAQYRAIRASGWDLHTHSCGDQAMRQTVDLYAKLLDEMAAANDGEIPDLRWSVIHAYFPIEPKTRVLDDMARYGIVAATNPVFNWQQGFSFATNSGPERMARLQPFRTYMRGGVIMASGSDYGVTTHDPWMGFYALLTRRDQKSGLVFGEDETVTIAEALRSYTWNGAYLTHDEDERGSLEPGRWADLVVLDLPSLDRLEEDPELLFSMRERIVATLVEGEVVHGALP